MALDLLQTIDRHICVALVLLGGTLFCEDVEDICSVTSSPVILKQTLFSTGSVSVEGVEKAVNDAGYIFGFVLEEVPAVLIARSRGEDNHFLDSLLSYNLDHRVILDAF